MDELGREPRNFPFGFQFFRGDEFVPELAPAGLRRFVFGSISQKPLVKMLHHLRFPFGYLVYGSGTKAIPFCTSISTRIPPRTGFAGKDFFTGPTPPAWAARLMNAPACANAACLASNSASVSWAAS